MHYARGQLYPPDQRFGIAAPGGMCRVHLEMRRGYRDMYFDDRSGNRWPGNPGSPFTIIDRDLGRELAWRRFEWDDKASEQMRLIEDTCLSGRSLQCEGPRTCTACRMMTCTCEYVVTFDRRPVAGPGAIEGLKRMPLAEAHSLVTDTHPRHGRIVNAKTLEVLP